MRRIIGICLIALMVMFVFGCATQETSTSKQASEEGEKVEKVEASAVLGKEYSLVILHTNDFHGHPLKFYNYPAPDVGGLPAIATLVDDVRRAYDHVLVLDAGDLNTGRPESNFFKAEPDIIGYNHVGYDAMVLGNHEFDHSLEDLAWQQDLAEFPFISANVKKQDGSYLTDPYIIKEFEGVRVGIFGLTTKETEVVGNPDFIQGLVFDDEVETARQMVAELEDRTDVIVALVHLGIYSSPDKGSRRVASEVDGIDLIIDGHTHTQLDEPIYENGTPIVQAWHWGLTVGKAEIRVKDREIIDFAWQPVPINLKERVKKEDGSTEYVYIGTEIPEDAELVTKLQPFADEVEAILSEVIGTATETFFNTDVRSRETALGDIVADSMLWYTKNLDVDFAIQNGGGIRADLPEGDIAKRLIYEILPFDNSVMVVTLAGTDVQALFDYIATIPQGKGAFPQVSEGIHYTVNYTTGKCEDILINGEPIDPDRMYNVTTNSYMAAGGDGYVMFKNATQSYDTSVFQRDVFINYIIELGGAITPAVKGRINIVGSSSALLQELVEALIG